ncbi:MAG: hypothetical protein KatS3mg031_2787 [Chitinophagales bacterium]|nr:MAG: hypothetical protein KatS3mg031_2787 [Chitinophagales bacterium]
MINARTPYLMFGLYNDYIAAKTGAKRPKLFDHINFYVPEIKDHNIEDAIAISKVIDGMKEDIKDVMKSQARTSIITFIRIVLKKGYNARAFNAALNKLLSVIRQSTDEYGDYEAPPYDLLNKLYGIAHYACKKNVPDFLLNTLLEEYQKPAITLTNTVDEYVIAEARLSS